MKSNLDLRKELNLAIEGQQKAYSEGRSVDYKIHTEWITDIEWLMAQRGM